MLSIRIKVSLSVVPGSRSWGGCVRRWRGLTALGIGVWGALTAPAQERSSLVWRGADGRLGYGTYSTEGDRVPDYSGVGYGNSEVPLPDVPVRATVPVGEGDRRAAIMAAVEAVAALPVDPATGFRGAVELLAGTYEVSDTVTILHDGLVLRGAGRGEGGTRVLFTKRSQDTCFRFGDESSRDGLTLDESSRRPVRDAYVAVGSVFFHVGTDHGFAVGDQVILDYDYNESWKAMIGMAATDWPGANGLWPATPDLEHERRVVGVDGAVIKLDAPALDPFQADWGRLDIVRVASDARLTRVGIEDMLIESSPDRNNPNDLEHGWKAVSFEGTTQAWARRVHARYFGYSCVSVVDEDSTFITVEDCVMSQPWGAYSSGRRYAFDINGHRILVQHCLSERGGRHCFVTGSFTPGPVVFYKCRTTEGRSDIGPHHRWSSGHLYDNVVTDNEIKVRNRGTTSTGSLHGWVGGQIMLWNCTAKRIVVESPPGPNTNWAVGCTSDVHGGEDYPQFAGRFELHQRPVQDVPSLFRAQLADRLSAAVPMAPPVAIRENSRSRVVNVSTRGFSGPGVQALTAGFVIAGDEEQTVLVRGVGPGLAAYDVPGTIADPVVEVYAGGATEPVGRNDNWTGGQVAELAVRVCAFALQPGSLDAAMAINLPPGAYTVLVTDRGGGTGIALAEVYEVD